MLYHSIAKAWSSDGDLMPKQAPVYLFLADPTARWMDGGLIVVSVVYVV